MGERKYGFDTLQVHAGQVPDPATGARAVPIYQTSSFVFKNFDEAVALGKVDKFGNTYTRIVNPTHDVLEQRIAALEGGTGALAVASGSAATTIAILNVANAGDEIVSAQTLYGGTYNLFSITLPKYGIKTRFVNPDDPENFRKAITPKTKAVFIETIGNPATNLIDIGAVSAIAHKKGIPLIVDNTFGTPYLIRPFDHGADVIVHSATKYIGGHGTTIGGLIVDGGKFDWSKSGKFPGFTTIDPGYNFSFWEKFGNYEGVVNIAFVVKARLQLLRDFGPCLSPQNAFLLLQGLETLSLRVQKHVANAQMIAEYLSKHKLVSHVDYPGLKKNPYNALAKKYFPKGVGSVFSFHIKGGQDAARKFIEALKIFSHLANVADAKSLVVHPATLTHGQLNEEQQRKAGINPDVVRLSIGIEDVKDLLWDLDQALKQAARKA
jgi:O-acetylhomoserine (thiol)-lyase